MTSAYNQGTVPVIEVRHRLRIAREHAGLDQDQLSELTGIARSTISNAENGNGATRRTTINAWALACGVPVQWILTGKETPPPDPEGPDGGLLLPCLDLNQEPPDSLHPRPRPYISYAEAA